VLELLDGMSRGPVAVRKGLMAEARLSAALAQLFSELTGSIPEAQAKALSPSTQEPPQALDSVDGGVGWEGPAAEGRAEAEVRLPAAGSGGDAALALLLRVLTNLARVDELRGELARRLLGPAGALVRACARDPAAQRLQGDVLLCAAMLLQQLAMAAADAEAEIGAGVFEGVVQTLLSTLARTHEASGRSSPNTTEPKVNEASAYMAFALCSLAATEAGQAYLLQVCVWVWVCAPDEANHTPSRLSAASTLDRV
jgi:hypothetical protein